MVKIFPTSLSISLSLTFITFPYAFLGILLRKSHTTIEPLTARQHFFYIAFDKLFCHFFFNQLQPRKVVTCSGKILDLSSIKARGTWPSPSGTGMPTTAAFATEGWVRRMALNSVGRLVNHGLWWDLATLCQNFVFGGIRYKGRGLDGVDTGMWRALVFFCTINFVHIPSGCMLCLRSSKPLAPQTWPWRRRDWCT